MRVNSVCCISALLHFQACSGTVWTMIYIQSMASVSTRQTDEVCLYFIEVRQCAFNPTLTQMIKRESTNIFMCMGLLLSHISEEMQRKRASSEYMHTLSGTITWKTSTASTIAW